MKRVNNLYEKIASLENLKLAFWKAARGKSSRKDVQIFRERLEENLQQLKNDLDAGTVKVGDYHYFKIYDPKERVICAASFRERVLHHAILNVCEPVFERFQIYDSYACRKGKGALACVRRAQYFCGKYRFYLKLDVHKYFDSIRHSILKIELARKFKDKRLLDLFWKIIDSYCVPEKPEQGLPIGNLTSQFFANLVLAIFDHKLKEFFRVDGYLRYMDDILIFENDKKRLKRLRERVFDFLRERLGLTFNKFQLNFTHVGIPFLGYRVFEKYLRLSVRSRRNFIRKILLAIKNRNTETMLSLLGFVLRAETFGLRSKFCC